MQYAFWQTVIEVGGRYFNYELAAILLQHSLEENPQDFVIKDEQLLEMIRRNSNLKNKINEIINKHKTEKEIYIPIGQEYVAFENSDLYFAIHNANIEMKAKQDSNSSWSIDITLSDTFDFTKWKTPLEYYFDANKLLSKIEVISPYGQDKRRFGYSDMTEITDEIQDKLNVEPNIYVNPNANYDCDVFRFEFVTNEGLRYEFVSNDIGPLEEDSCQGISKRFRLTIAVM